MKGYYCPKCKKTKKDPSDKRKGLKTELHYEQLQGMRLKREHKNKLMYYVYCPKCKEYFYSEK